jgi:hypothetical protein
VPHSPGDRITREGRRSALLGLQVDARILGFADLAPGGEQPRAPAAFASLDQEIARPCATATLAG